MAGGRRGDAGRHTAMKHMARANPNGRASNAMILFLVVNTSSVQLLPTTMIALRAQAGAANPADIVLPTLLATAVQPCAGVESAVFWAGGSAELLRSAGRSGIAVILGGAVGADERL